MSELYEYTMKCGCSAFAYKVVGGERFPCCFTHAGVIDADGDDIGLTVAGIQPNLDGRVARCAYGCGSESESRVTLPFFQFCGEGSFDATMKCKHCGYYEVAHTKPGDFTCGNFEPHGAYEFDQYYCGCRGWD